MNPSLALLVSLLLPLSAAASSIGGLGGQQQIPGLPDDSNGPDHRKLPGSDTIGGEAGRPSAPNPGGPSLPAASSPALAQSAIEAQMMTIMLQYQKMMAQQRADMGKTARAEAELKREMLEKLSDSLEMKGAPAAQRKAALERAAAQMAQLSAAGAASAGGLGKGQPDAADLKQKAALDKLAAEAAQMKEKALAAYEATAAKRESKGSKGPMELAEARRELVSRYRDELEARAEKAGLDAKKPVAEWTDALQKALEAAAVKAGASGKLDAAAEAKLKEQKLKQFQAAAQGLQNALLAQYQLKLAKAQSDKERLQLQKELMDEFRDQLQQREDAQKEAFDAIMKAMQEKAHTISRANFRS